MADNDNASFDKADDNLIQNFQLETSSLRGRSVRLGKVLHDILEAHDYPGPVAQMVAETATLALLLSSMLKYDGIFTLQAKGDGPVSLLVADVTSDGDLRACATFDAEAVNQTSLKVQPMRRSEGEQSHLAQYLGSGYLVFTVDQEQAADRYQGIVELKGTSLIDSVLHYFTQSEQIGTSIRMAAGKRSGQWRSGGIMLQRMPFGSAETGKAENAEEDWRRSLALMGSVREDEMLDPNLHSNALLMRLFHEEGVRVYAPVDIRKNCRCSTQKVEDVLTTLGREDLDYMVKNGKIEVRCEFCSRDFTFDPQSLRSKIDASDTTRNS